MSQNGKLMPNLDEKSTKLLNLTVLQRIDPFVEEILITAAHVTFYEFNIDTSQWEYSTAVPVYSNESSEHGLLLQGVKHWSICSVSISSAERIFCCATKPWINNLVENLLGDFEYEVQVPYLLYRNASQEVNGIWFYNARECEEVANLFSRHKKFAGDSHPFVHGIPTVRMPYLEMLRILNAYSKVPTKSKVSPTKSEFEELEAFPTLTVMDGPLEPSSSTTSNVADVPDDRAFVNFFSTAMNIGSSPNVAVSGQPYHSSATVVSAHPQNVTLPTLPSAQKPATLSSSTPIMSILENPDSNTTTKRSADLPFPPPTPPPSLTPTPVPAPNYGPVISREKVREALQMLVQLLVSDIVISKSRRNLRRGLTIDVEMYLYYASQPSFVAIFDLILFPEIEQLLV
ncbi:hypothetical protein DH2020_021015 [Rehmannia glutinosa]|uniref:mRNA-decapping enzyme-like protein n=1 Tax=Rehmannia glutinosa TaxID=99300 RepID=A0ABR0WDJ5_REHGL